VVAVDPRAEGAVAHLELRDAKNNTILQLGASGWVETAAALADYKNVVVVWNRDSSYFAMKVREGKTDASVTAYKNDNGTISAITPPDFQQAVKKALGFYFEGRFYFESPVHWINNRTVQIEIEGNTVDSIDPDGEYDFICELDYRVTSGKILNVHLTKKALPPPPRQ
jgi:hypothetical protein